MTRVFEVLPLEPFREFELQAGRQGLQKEITNVTILDYETDSRDYSAFRPGDFILSSLYFAKDDESLILDAFRALIRRGISGFAIKTVYYFTIPEKLRELADAAGVPVFTFRTTSMEDIIIAVNQLDREKALEAKKADLLHRLLRTPLDDGTLTALSGQLDEELKPWCMAAYATLRQPGEYDVLPSRRLTRSVPMDEDGLHYTMLIWQGGVLLLLSAQTLPESKLCRELLLRKLEALHLPPARCRVGFGDLCLSRRQLDAGINQSICANRMCALWDKARLSWDQLGTYRFLLPLLDAPGCKAECRRQMAELLAYDEAHGTALAPTLTAWVSAGGDINRASETLYQHPNTVRYRLKKARALWGDPADFDRQAFLCVQLYQLSQELREQGL